MRVLCTVVLILLFVITGLKTGQIEVHSDHQVFEENHSQDLTLHSETHHSHKSSKKESSKDDCQHFHFHSTPMANQVVARYSVGETSAIGPAQSIQARTHNLRSQYIENSLYRPPIS